MGLVVLLGLAAACSGGGDSPTTPGGGTQNPGGGTTAPTTGTIAGTVTAAGGAGLSGAVVSTQPATAGATTNAQGGYSIASVAPASYSVTATLAGYATATASVSVVAGQTATANLTMAAAGYTFTQVGQLQASTQGVSAIALSPNGQLLAYGEYGVNTIKIIDAQTRQLTRTLSGHTAPVTVLAFSPDGRYLASQGTVNLPPAVDGVVRVWDVTTGTQLASASMTPGGVLGLTFSANGSLLAGAGGGSTPRVQLWTPATLTPVRTINNVFSQVAFSPDGQRMATLGRDDLVHIIEVATGTQVATYAGHVGWATSAAYNRTGTILASGGEDRMIRLWNPSNGQPVRTIAGHVSYPDYMEFSPDGTVLASLGSGVNITRVGSSISFTIGSADQRLRLWNVSTGEAMSAPDTGTDAVGSVTFSADWRSLVTANGSNGLIRFFGR